jgi:hypothetical protein
VPLALKSAPRKRSYLLRVEDALEKLFERRGGWLGRVLINRDWSARLDPGPLWRALRPQVGHRGMSECQKLTPTLSRSDVH